MRVSLPFIVLAAGGVAGQSISDAFASLPLCGQSCLIPILQSTSCNLTTIPQVSQCLCADAHLHRKVSACLQSACNSTEQYVFSKASQLLCAGYPVPSKGYQILGTIIGLSSVAVPLILLRFFWRLLYTKLWWDDYMILIAAVVLVVQLAMVILVIQKGFGKHLWDINFLEASNLLKIYYIIQVLYVIVQKLVKLSILVSYLRIFPETIRWFRISIYVTIVFSAGHGTLITLLTALQCLPVASIWDMSITGKCINVQAIIYAGTAFSIVDDILIMTLPIPCFSSLQMGRLKKISIGAMFSIGSLSCIASAIRLKYVGIYGDLTDSTWDNVDTTIWSTVEIFTAAIGACLPALRQILQRLFPKTFSIKYNTTTSGRNSYQNMSRKVPSSYLSSQPRNVNRSYPRSVNSSGGDDVANADAVGARRLSGDLNGTELVAVHPRRLSAEHKGVLVSTQGVGGMS